MTLDEAAGFLRLRRRTLDELRRADPTFAALVVLVTPGAPRITRARLEAWLASRPCGWSTMGGARDTGFGRSSGAAPLPEEGEAANVPQAQASAPLRGEAHPRGET